MAIFTHMSTIVGGNFAHLSGISDLEVFESGGQISLYSASFSDGGINSFSLAQGQQASLINSVGYGPNRGTLGLNGIDIITVNDRDVLIPSGQYDDAPALHQLGSGGDLTGIQTLSNNPVEISNIEHGVSVVAGGNTYYLASQMGQDGFSVFRIRDDLSFKLKGQYLDTDSSHIADISAVASVNKGHKAFFFAASAQDGGLTSYQVKPNGTVLEKDSFAPTDGPGFSNPNALAAVSIGHKTFVFLGAAGTGTITVLKVNGKGQLKVVDHVLDTSETRFAGVAALEIFESGGRWFLLAGGSDDGISLFEIAPTGKLFLIATIADQQDTTLTNVTTIATASFGTEIQVFVAGDGEAGITQFSLDLGDLGEVIEGTNRSNILIGGAADDLIIGKRGWDRLFGGAGNDRLLDGRGRDHLTGGDGADIFVFEQDHQTDFIRDFVLGEDKIDMSDFDMLYYFGALKIWSRDFGAVIKFAGERIKIYSEDGQPINPGDFSQDDFIF